MLLASLPHVTASSTLFSVQWLSSALAPSSALLCSALLCSAASSIEPLDSPATATATPTLTGLTERSTTATNSASAMSVSKEVQSVWRSYLRNLEVNPITTKALTSAVLSVVSDVLAQTLGGTPLSQVNVTSLRNQFIIGLLIRGPIVHYWYIVLEKLFIKLGYSPKQQNATLPALTKVFLDQTVFSFPFNLLYFYAIGALEGRSLNYIQDKVSREFMPLMIANLKVWPLVNILNFTVVPENLRVLFGNLVGIAWGVFMMQLTSKPKTA